MSDVRVLMVDLNARGGVALYTRDLCQAMARHGADVSLLVPFTYELADRPLDFTMLPRLVPALTDRPGVSRLRCGVRWWGRAVANGRIRNRTARAGDYDVVHLQGAIGPTELFLLRSIAGRRPLLLTVHDTVPHDTRLFRHPAIRRRLYRMFDRLIVHYERGVRNLEERYGVRPDRVTVIPHGLEMRDAVGSSANSRARLTIPAEAKVLLFFGAIRPDKGLDVLIEAVARVARDVPDVLLVIAGSVPNDGAMQRYDALIDRLQVAKHVLKRVCFIPEEDVTHYLTACDVCVLPYKHFESQSGVLTQAYVHYKPVVVTDVGAMGDMVRADGVGVVVAPNDVAALVDGLTRMLTDPRPYLAHCGPETTSKYTWDKSAARTLACYRQLIEERRR